MGPVGYPGPSPFVDEEWPPRAWVDPSLPVGAPPAMPPGVESGASIGARAAEAAPDAWPPPEWLAPEAAPQGPPPGMEPSVAAPVTPAPPMAGPAGAGPGAPPAGAPPPLAKPKTAAPGKPVDPYVSAQGEIAGEKNEAIDKETAARQAEADFRSQRGVEAAGMTQLQLRQAERDNEDVRKFGQLRTKQLTDEIDAAGNTKIDQGRVWRNKSTGDKILAAAALFLSGFSSVMTGKNPALDAWNRVLDQDFEAQQLDIANKKDSLKEKRGILAEELAAGRDAYEARVKHTLMGYDLALKAIDAEAGKWQSPQMQAKAQGMKAEVKEAAMGKIQEFTRYQEEKGFRQQQADRQNSLGWYNANTARNAQQDEAQARKDAADAKAAGKQLPIKGNDGSIVGYAASEKEQDDVRQTVVAKGKMDSLYKRGRELFADGWAAPGSERRARQDAWNQDWAMARRHASGDHSAPNKDDQKNWGLDTGRTITNNNMDVLDEAYDIAVDNGAATLRASGIGDDALKTHGYVRPPKAPTPGTTTKLWYRDGQGVLNQEGSGEPLSPDESAAHDRYLARENATINENTNRSRKEMKGHGSAEPSRVTPPSAEYEAPETTEEQQAVIDQYWASADPKTWPQWYREKVAAEKSKKGRKH